MNECDAGWQRTLSIPDTTFLSQMNFWSQLWKLSFEVCPVAAGVLSGTTEGGKLSLWDRFSSSSGHEVL